MLFDILKPEITRREWQENNKIILLSLNSKVKQRLLTKTLHINTYDQLLLLHNTVFALNIVLPHTTVNNSLSCIRVGFPYSGLVKGAIYIFISGNTREIMVIRQL